jgi:hypothetical protein
MTFLRELGPASTLIVLSTIFRCGACLARADFRMFDFWFNRALVPVFGPEPSGVVRLFFADGHNMTSQ